MNGIDFPVARVLAGIDAARAAGLDPVKVNVVVRRGLNDADVVPMARWARTEGLTVRFIEYMDVGPLERLEDGRRRDRGGDRRDDRARVAARAGGPGPARRRGRSVALRGRRRRGRRHRVGQRSPSAATARARASPLSASCTRACSRRAGPTCGRFSATVRPTTRSGDVIGRTWAAAMTDTRSCGPRRPRACRGWRCSRSEADAEPATGAGGTCVARPRSRCRGRGGT